MRQGDEFIINMTDYVLMNSRWNLSEIALGRNACAALGLGRAPRVLVSGLGMGITLRAVLDGLPGGARVTVAELNPVVVEWCRGPLADLTDFAVADLRVDLQVIDVAKLIGAAARKGPKFDAIVLDLYQGTHDANSEPDHPFYGRRALETTRLALDDAGVLAVWTEHPDRRFEDRLEVVGFSFERTRHGKGGPHHAVYVAQKAPPSPRQRRRRRAR